MGYQKTENMALRKQNSAFKEQVRDLEWQIATLRGLAERACAREQIRVVDAAVSLGFFRGRKRLKDAIAALKRAAATQARTHKVTKV